MGQKESKAHTHTHILILRRVLIKQAVFNLGVENTIQHTQKIRFSILNKQPVDTNDGKANEHDEKNSNQ